MIVAFDDIRVGQAVPALEAQITHADLIRYAGAADDYAPGHWDRDMMRAAGMPDVNVHGWLTCAHLLRALTGFIPLEIADVATYEIKYLRPAFPGLMSLGGAVVAKAGRTAEVELWAKDGEGQITTTARVVVTAA